MLNFKDLFKKLFLAKNINSLKKMDKYNILIVAAIVGILVVGALIFMKNSGSSFSGFGLLGPSSDKVAQTAVDYINNNGLTETQASLVSVSEESGLVKIKIKIGENEFDSYASKDGKLLIPQAIDMSSNSGQ
ncbi:MAG: hypothetical protein Q8Q48_02645 [Candidatus Staskawiczbacteria bacterium]|nr:hypothetical protein [Candidatus Staskawiczbacteria bacterium]